MELYQYYIKSFYFSPNLCCNLFVPTSGYYYCQGWGGGGGEGEWLLGLSLTTHVVEMVVKVGLDASSGSFSYIVRVTSKAAHVSAVHSPLLLLIKLNLSLFHLQ